MAVTGRSKLSVGDHDVEACHEMPVAIRTGIGFLSMRRAKTTKCNPWHTSGINRSWSLTSVPLGQQQEAVSRFGQLDHLQRDAGSHRGSAD